MRVSFRALVGLALLALLTLAGRSPSGATPVGAGRFTFAPAGEVTAGSPILWRLRYRVGEAGIASGGSLLLRFPHAYYFMYPFNWMPEPDASGALPVSVSASSGAPVQVRLSDQGWHPNVLRFDLPQGLRAGDELSITVGSEDPDHRSLAPRYASSGFAPLLLADLHADGVYQQVEAVGSLTVRADRPESCELIAASQARTGVAVPVTVRLRDRFGNIASPVDPVRVEIRVEPSSRPDESKVVVLARGDEGWRKVQGPVLHRSGVARLVGVSSLGGRPLRSNPIRVTDAEPDVEWFWGDLQGHSGMSDGTGSGAEYYQSASGPGALDFIALTDHEWQLTADEWAIVQRLCRERYRPGEFVPLLAWEYSLGGHRVVYYKDCTVTPEDAAFDGPKEIWEVELNHAQIRSWTRDAEGRPLLEFGDASRLLEAHRGSEALIVPHTSATTHMGNDWDTFDSSSVPLVEIYSAHGSDESADCPRPVSPWVERGSARSALARGYRLGFVASSDGHDGNPGHTLSGPHPGGLTALVAPRLDRDSVWSALRERRVYATTGARILVSLEVNGRPMGSQVTASEPPLVRLEAHGTDVIERIDLVAGGQVAHSFVPETLDFSGSYRDESFAGSTYYYLRVVQRDGEIAWSSPVWATSPEVPTVTGLRAFATGTGITVEWEADLPERSGRYELLRRRGNDGGGAAERYGALATVEPRTGRMVFEDRDLPESGITCYYLLRWLPAPSRADAGPAERAAAPVNLALLSAERRATLGRGPGGIAIPYFLEEPGKAQIEIIDLRNRVVRRVEVEQQAGGGRFLWDGLDDQGRPCRGLHFYVVTSAGYSTQRKPLRMEAEVR